MKILTFKIYTGMTSFILSDCMETFREIGHTVETLVLPESGVVSKRDFIQELASINPDFLSLLSITLGLRDHYIRR
ncbi:TPA: hypothetical protein DCX15_02280 [bacterium]|nr:hypothetical protein [bacterium]